MIVGAHHEQRAGQRVDEFARGIRELGGCPEPLELGAHGLDRGAAHLVARVDDGGEHREAATVEAADGMVDRVG